MVTIIIKSVQQILPKEITRPTHDDIHVGMVLHYAYGLLYIPITVDVSQYLDRERWIQCLLVFCALNKLLCSMFCGKIIGNIEANVSV